MRQSSRARTAQFIEGPSPSLGEGWCIFSAVSFRFSIAHAPDSLHIVRANGIDIAYLERGSGPLVICLHGFPDTAWSFAPVLDELATRGYRVVAPFLRGYAPTEMPADGDGAGPRWRPI